MRLRFGTGLLVALALGVGPAGGSPAEGPSLIFASNRTENLHSEIYGVGDDGTDRRNVSLDPHADEFLRLSPDGDRIAFVTTAPDSRPSTLPRSTAPASAG